MRSKIPDNMLATLMEMKLPSELNSKRLGAIQFLRIDWQLLKNRGDFSKAFSQLAGLMQLLGKYPEFRKSIKELHKQLSHYRNFVLENEAEDRIYAINKLIEGLQAELSPGKFNRYKEILELLR